MKSNILTKARPRLQFQEFIANNTSEGSACHIFIAQPTPLEEKNFGKLFVLLELTKFQNKAEEIFTKIKKGLATQYYCSEDFVIEVAFENALQHTNQIIQNITATHSDDWLRYFHAIIAVAKDQEMHLTSAGKAQGFLMQSDKILDILQHENTHVDTNPLKIFSSILSGNIREGDSLFFSTESILDFFSQEKIKRIIQENAPEEAMQQFYAILGKSQTHNFAGIIIKSAGEEPTQTSTTFVSDQQNSIADEVQDSMQRLIEQEQTTSELLTPSLWPKIKTNFSFTKEKNPQKHFTPTRKTETTQAEQMPEAQKTFMATLTMFLLAGVRKIFYWLAIGFTKGVQIIATLIQKDKMKKFPKRMVHFPQKTGNILGRSVLWFQRLSRPRKILLFLSIIFIVLFVQSIAHQGTKREESQALLGYEMKIDEAAKKIDESKAALLYKNEEGARAFLTEAQALLAGIPENAPMYEEKVVLKKTEIQTQLNEINHIRNLDTEAQAIVDFSSLGADISLGNLAIAKDTFIVSDSINGNIYARKENNNPEVLLSDTNPQNAFKRITFNDDQLIGLTQSGALKQIEFSKKEAANIKVDFSESEKQAADLAFYNGRLYVLDAQKNQIRKHTQTSDDFGKGENWISDANINISDATSLAIDGAIYVLKKDGSVIKLFSGTRDPEFKQFALEPKLSDPQKIETTETGKNIYILDAQNRRIVILTKEGGLVTQYVSEHMNSLRDFAISENEKTLYFLNNTQLYRVNIGQ